MQFVYLVMRYPKDSAYLFSQHISHECVTHIYAIYDNMQSAVYSLYNLYTENGAWKGKSEYAIIKKSVSSTFRGEEQ